MRIRASSLPSFQNCPRSWAVENLPQLTAKALRERGEGEKPTKGIGALIGTCDHDGTAYMLETKRDFGRWSWRDAVKLAHDRLDEEMQKHTVVWDQFARKTSVAKEQIERAIAEIAEEYLPKTRPYLIEQELKLIWRTEWQTILVCDEHLRELEGDRDFEVQRLQQVNLERVHCSRCTKDLEDKTCDVVVHLATWLINIRGVGELIGHFDHLDKDGWIDDFKFGARLGAYQSQGGAYMWLVSSNLEEELQGFRQIQVRRTVKKAVPMVKLAYSFDGCLNSAKVTLDLAFESLMKYKLTGDLWAFNSHPNNKYCTQKTCKAFKTSLCDQWIEEVQGENEGWEM